MRSIAASTDGCKQGGGQAREKPPENRGQNTGMNVFLGLILKDQ